MRSIHERLFFRPLLESFSGAKTASRMTADTVRERLAAFGFRDAERTRAALRELTSGLTRSSRLMEQMLPVLLDWLSETPDPDLGLLGLRRLMSAQHQQLVIAFRESPETARRVCLLLGTSRLLAEPLRQNPDLLTSLGDESTLRPRDREDLLRQAETVLGLRHGRRQRQRGLLRIKQEGFLRIAARDLLDMDDVSATGMALTQLAEAMIDAALTRVSPSVPMAVVAMGRFGGDELSYASDLDILLVCKAGTASELQASQESASSLLRLLNGETPAERIFTIDAQLRPEGRSGRLVRSISGYRAYYSRWGQTWERQALVRARLVGGDSELGGQFMGVVEDFV
ncbi:MAG: bifunctional [glutamine synthetase] adenylyltransferase/[glutamine synthetase]-adenylyl-L-tyrosine phosphorylase, partial [Acidimicrobiales bacterium]